MTHREECLSSGKYVYILHLSAMLDVHVLNLLVLLR